MEVREPDAQYFSQTQLVQTELGLFPADWKLKRLCDLKPFITSGSRGWADYYAEFGSAFIRISNLTREHIELDLHDLRRVALPEVTSEGKRTQLRTGDLLISITADIGIVGYVCPSVPSPAYINQHIALVRVEPSGACAKFLAYFLASSTSQRAVLSLTDAGAKLGMNLATVGEGVSEFLCVRRSEAFPEFETRFSF